MKKEKLYLIIIISISAIYFLLTKNLKIGDDTIFHTTNILSIASTKSILPPKILPLITNNLGYGVNIFYPPFPHFLGSIIYRITKNIEITMRLLGFISISLSGITMYIYTKKVFKNKEVALISSLLYLSSPYLFTDVFTRCALNESFLFPILPLIFLSFYYLEKDEEKNFYLYFIISFTLCIYTHLVLTVYITILSIVYLLIFKHKILTKEKIKHLIKASLITLCLTSPFLLPLLEHYFQKDYAIFLINYTNENTIKTYPIYYFFFPFRYFSGAKNPLRFYIAPITLIYLAFTYILFWKGKIEKKEKKYIISFLIIFLISILFETVSITWNLVPNILKNIQFSWRLSLFVTFTTAIIAAQGINIWHEKAKKYILILTCLIIIISSIIYAISLPKKEKKATYLDKTCCYYTWQGEYLPKNAYQNRNYLSKRQNIITNDKNINIKIIKETFPNLTFKVDNLKEKITIEIPRIYYLGYELKNNNKKIKLSQNKHGLLQAEIEKNGTYHLKYQKTLLEKISIIVVIIAIIYLLNLRKKYKEQK